MDHAETIGDVRIVDPVAVPGPSRTRPEAAFVDPLEPREIHAPDIPFPRRQRTPVREMLQALPGEGDLGRPSPVPVGRVIDGAVHVHRPLQARQVPLAERPAAAARMGVAGLDSPERIHQVGALQVELGMRAESALHVGVLPHVEPFHDGSQGVQFEFIVTVFPGDEDFHVVFLADHGIALRVRRPHVGVLHPEAHVQVVVVPEHRGSRVEQCRPARLLQVLEARRTDRVLPRRLVEPPVHHDGTDGPARGVVLKPFF